ncbi:conserved hypothetical protein [Limnobacter sp. 130]|uniref:DUF1840 domain-containing protein n=1 Tax=Limnobacter sp. 130 TaxID=2653147 RepID=UPI0012F0BAC8|nr:DUF1840 domain-containing protein [Limnobacter sp. 130]VWX34743.1 conserved hypothetical protein [Limnobacter sp. 130]
MQINSSDNQSVNRMGIVKFKSKAAGDIVMFKSNAEQLFRIMGIEASERGVIEPQDLAHAHAQLVAAVNMERMAKAENPVNEDELTVEEKIALKNHVALEQRAFPLLKMLEEAQKKNVDVHWGF